MAPAEGGFASLILRRMQYRPLASWCATALALALAACGGGSDSPGSVATLPNPAATHDPSAPAATGNTAADALARFNWRRQQAGILPVARNAAIDAAALGHSEYQRQNNTITHVQEAGRPGFTGVSILDRMQSAGYAFSASQGYAYGEVIASRGDTQGAAAAEDLIGAIYHRFVVMEPLFKEAGAGAGTSSLTYVTINFAANGFDRALPAGVVVSYPFPNQADVPTGVSSDQESPDPVPGQNLVGYPVSVHGTLGSRITVQSFTITPRGGSPLATRIITSSTDANAPTSAAAAIPLSVLAPGTTYDVRFAGTVDGVDVSRTWTFRTL